MSETQNGDSLLIEYVNCCYRPARLSIAFRYVISTFGSPPSPRIGVTRVASGECGLFETVLAPCKFLVATSITSWNFRM